MNLNDRQHDTVIAALRLYQQKDWSEHPPEIQDIALEHGVPLSQGDIDYLIERLNEPE